MPKTYYRCSKCHSKIKYEMDEWGIRIQCICPKHGKMHSFQSYICLHNYWWERLLITVASIILGKNLLKRMRDKR